LGLPFVIFFWLFLFLSGKGAIRFGTSGRRKLFTLTQINILKRQGHHNPAFSVLPIYSGLGF
jgi:hypothetical protein